jgi:retinol dehydrogenase-12
VQSAAKEFVGKEKRLDKLWLNAGVMALPPGLTEQGYEIQFGTNHVGHALLVKLLLPMLLKTAEEPGSDVRVVSLSSAGHATPPWGGIKFDLLKTTMDSYFTTTLFRYGQSKLANILFAKELARRYPSLTSVAIHPGVVSTDLFDAASKWPGAKPIWGLVRGYLTTVQDGAKNQLWAGTAEGVKTGLYYMPIGIAEKGSAHASNPELAKKLWEWTEHELEGYTL